MPSRKWQRNGLIDGRLGTYGKEEKEGRKERRKSFRGGPWRGSEMAATEFVIFENGQIIFLSLSQILMAWMGEQLPLEATNTRGAKSLCYHLIG